MILNVETENGKRSLRVYDGDSPRDVANAFVRKHKMGEDGDDTRALVDAIAAHIENNLTLS